VIVELKRADDGSFVLVMQGVTHDIEPHTLRLATSTTCTNYARDMGGVKGVEGEAVVHKAFRGRGDAPWGEPFTNAMCCPLPPKLLRSCLQSR
jgi:hypothetical protein